VPDDDVTLALIAGGQGRRLGGAPKGLLRYQGRTLIERLLELRPLVADAFIVANDAAYDFLGVPVVPDVVPRRGAPGGVHAALVTARTRWVLAVAADMPFVSSEVVKVLLAENRDHSDVVCFRAGGRPEPLLGLYRTALAARWAVLLPGGPSFRDLFAHCRVHGLPEARRRAVYPDLQSVLSVNTADDLRTFGISGVDL
jgi:molybdenum cofactor guanylyltransferase